MFPQLKAANAFVPIPDFSQEIAQMLRCPGLPPSLNKNQDSECWNFHVHGFIKHPLHILLSFSSHLRNLLEFKRKNVFILVA